MATALCDGVLEELLEAGGEPSSGTKLARKFGVSRAAVWKSVETLRARGYEIASVPGRGYLLEKAAGEPTPVALSVLLGECPMGTPHRHVEETESTNRAAVAWADEGAPEGALITAAKQIAGRGRLGRQWLDLPGESLLMSLVLRPSVELTRINGITFVAAIALAEALSSWIDEERIEIKWPNDVLLEGRKVAGILLESQLEGAAARFVVLGLGLNVGGGLDELDEEIRQLATTVSANVAEGEPPTVVEALAGFLKCFDGLYARFIDEGLEGIRSRWNHWFRMAGRRVSVKVGARTVSGEVLGLDAEGALELRTDGGAVERILAGDVMLSTTRG